MSRGELLLWIVVPYVCLTTFAVGHVWRYRRDQLSWTTRSTQLLEGRLLRAGSNLFHIGLLNVLAGHVLGILVPESATRKVGISESLYHDVSVAAGTTFGAMMTAGFVILMLRRAGNARVRRTTSRVDVLTYLLLAVVIGTGMYATVGVNLLGGGYDYRLTVGPWFRGLFLLSPHSGAMLGAPFVYQAHAVSLMALYALWPFSRLVHAWSVPVGYLRRAHIVYRRRLPAAARV